MSTIIHTDGSSLGNPGPWGRAAVITRNGKDTIVSGNARNVTNNQMELQAVVEVLLALKREVTPWFMLPSLTSFGAPGSGLFEEQSEVSVADQTFVDEKIVLITDSEYVRKWVTERLETRVRRGWRRSKGGQLIWNIDLRQNIYALLPYFPNLTWKRVKGHAGDKMYEIVDGLARREAEKVM